MFRTYTRFYVRALCFVLRIRPVKRNLKENRVLSLPLQIYDRHAQWPQGCTRLRIERTRSGPGCLETLCAVFLGKTSNSHSAGLKNRYPRI